MILYNRLFLDAYVMVNRFLQSKRVDFYPTSVGKSYSEIYKRDTFACLSFVLNDETKSHYYLYFNASYDSDINRMIFSSIAVVSRESLNTGRYSHTLKKHIEDIKDVETFLQSLEGML